MKEVFAFLTACAVLAVANALTTAIAVALLFAALMGALTYPRRTFGLAAALGLMALAIKEPLACVGALGAVGSVAVIAANLVRRATTVPAPDILLLPDRSGERATEN